MALEKKHHGMALEESLRGFVIDVKGYGPALALASIVVTMHRRTYPSRQF